MAYNNKATLKDVDGNPISQYFNPTLDRYEPVEGIKGGNKVILYNENGTQNNSLSLLPILGKLDQLAGSVVDEVQRQSNEVARLALYNDMQSKLSSGYFKGAKGDKGDKGEQGIQGIQGEKGLKGDIGLTGQRGEKGNPFVYSDFTQPQLDLLKVKGDKGDKGDVGERGEKGEKGDPFKYTDFTQAQLLGLKGDKGDTGERGIQGEQGIQGDKGEKGDTGEVENLTPTHITEALGYTPVDTTDSRLSDTRVPKTHSHVIGDLPPYPTSLPANGGNSTTTNGFTLGMNVPAGSKLTDTNTTYSEITEAEITAGTASTLRTITGRRIGFLKTWVQNLVSAITKADIGLSNLTNDKQMPISGGVLENYTEKYNLTTGVIDLNLGNVFLRSVTANTTFTITNTQNGVHSFTLIISMPSTVRTLSFPSSIMWQGGEIPNLSTASKTYILTFVTVNGGTTWLGMFGGEF